LTRETRVKALRQPAFKVAHLAAGGIAFCIFYFCAGPNLPDIHIPEVVGSLGDHSPHRLVAGFAFLALQVFWCEGRDRIGLSGLVIVRVKPIMPGSFFVPQIVELLRCGLIAPAVHENSDRKSHNKPGCRNLRVIWTKTPVPSIVVHQRATVNGASLPCCD
jgi:hypothetical protein